MDNKKSKKTKKCNKNEVYNQEGIKDLKESYKLGKEYYNNVEKKVDN